MFPFGSKKPTSKPSQSSSSTSTPNSNPNHTQGPSSNPNSTQTTSSNPKPNTTFTSPFGNPNLTLQERNAIIKKQYEYWLSQESERREEMRKVQETILQLNKKHEESQGQVRKWVEDQNGQEWE
ncbi:hypothetical protein M231_02463 [Tremella mesenterica]|uniref:Uncharacterized protein n=1 Tax=Tremella mesenterica TaxID=5217 RepID=A0A4Q1BQI4_TREME|nr:hypothetical protein M231_02463 [Tremella mesenterica]